ncbi:MAG: hypothetical protein ABI779_13140 [Acidobacteriota bacterium]
MLSSRAAVAKWQSRLAAVFALAPLVLSWILKACVWPRPFWIVLYDPETIYFYSGLSLLRGWMPENIDNPGTPLQVISAVLAAVTGPTPLRYEAFLTAAHFVGLLLSLTGALAIFYGVMKGAPPLARVTAVWAYLLAPVALERLGIWSPELLYLPLGACALALLRLWLEVPSPRGAFGAGAVIGVGIAAKFAFLIWVPALLLAMLSVRRLRHALLAMVGVGLGFLCGTLPVMRGYGMMFRRLLVLSGSGQEQTWPVLLGTSRLWQGYLLLLLVLAIWHFRRAQLPLQVFAVSLLVFGVLAVARNPNFRYLLPTAFIAVALMAIVAASPKFTVPLQVAVLLVTGVFLGRTFVNDIRAHRERIAGGQLLRREIAAAVPPGGVTVYGWRVPQPSFALRVMATDPADLRDVSRLYPREGHLSPWNGAIVLPTGSCRWDTLVAQERELEVLPPGSYEIVRRVGEYAIARPARVIACR